MQAMRTLQTTQRESLGIVLWAGVSENGCWNLNPTWRHRTCCTRETRDMFSRVAPSPWRGGEVGRVGVFLVRCTVSIRVTKQGKTARRWIWTTWEWGVVPHQRALVGVFLTVWTATLATRPGNKMSHTLHKSSVGSNNSRVQSVPPLLGVHIHVITWISHGSGTSNLYMTTYTTRKTKNSDRQSYRWEWIRERLGFFFVVFFF